MYKAPPSSAIGQPYNIKHHIHVELDQDGVGFKGLPEEWKDKVVIEKKRAMKIVESPDALFHSDPDLRCSTMTTTTTTTTKKRELHLSTHSNSRQSILKATVLKAVKIIQDQDKGKNNNNNKRKTND